MFTKIVKPQRIFLLLSHFEKAFQMKLRAQLTVLATREAETRASKVQGHPGPFEIQSPKER